MTTNTALANVMNPMVEGYKNDITGEITKKCSKCGDTGTGGVTLPDGTWKHSVCATKKERAEYKARMAAEAAEAAALVRAEDAAADMAREHGVTPEQAPEDKGPEVKVTVDPTDPCATTDGYSLEDASAATPAEPPATPKKAAIKATAKRLVKEVLEATGTTLPAEPAKEPEPANFLMFVGDAFYTKEAFLAESKEQGVSKRMPSYHLPVDLVVGKSRVYLAAGGERKGSTEPTAEVFGYFTPDAVEFIAGLDGTEDKAFAEVVGYVRKNLNGRIVVDTTKEAPRKCGRRKLGGTYLVTDSKSPVVEIPAVPYRGNHFRGMMKLDATMLADIESGKGLDRLFEVECDDCAAKYLAGADTIKNKAREDRRVEKGDTRNWHARCPECAKKEQARKREERKAKAAGSAEPSAEAVTATIVGEEDTTK